MHSSTYYVYILTNKNKTTLYIGVTNNLQKRHQEHCTGQHKGFSKKYNCHHLVYYEEFSDINRAISREKEIKNWRREKKNSLIETKNPGWKFLQL